MRIIYNPAAGQGTAESRIPEVESLLTEQEIDFELVRTERPGDAIGLAESAADGRFFAVVAAGGDGTAHEVLNGLMLAKEKGKEIPAMGVLSVGRGNDFAFGIGIPHDLQQAVSLLRTGKGHRIDVGYLKGGDYPEGRYFGNGIGIGFDTIVGFEAAKLKRLTGFTGYLVGALKTMSLYYRAQLMRFDYGGAERAERAIQVSIMNGRRMGGAFFMTPKAATDDGLFDLCIVGEPKRREMLGLIVRYLGGTQEKSRHVHMEQTREIAVEAIEGTLAVHADGETICEGGKRIEFTCIPSAVEMLCEHDSPQ